MSTVLIFSTILILIFRQFPESLFRILFFLTRQAISRMRIAIADSRITAPTTAPTNVRMGAIAAAVLSLSSCVAKIPCEVDTAVA